MRVSLYKHVFDVHDFLLEQQHLKILQHEISSSLLEWLHLFQSAFLSAAFLAFSPVNAAELVLLSSLVLVKNARQLQLHSLIGSTIAALSMFVFVRSLR